VSSQPPGIADPVAPGARLGRLEIGARAATGGMSEVFRAVDTETGKTVALKLLKLPSDPTEAAFARHRFDQEAEAVARLDHPAVVRLHSAGTTPDGTPYLALEWVDGRDLGALFREEQPPPWRVLRLVRSVALAVVHAHDNGVVHRDLKASNILVCGEDDVRLIDFGLALLDGSTDPPGVRALGSAHSMAPEQVSGGGDRRSDVYSLGVILYRGLVGRYPFHSRQAVQILAAHLLHDVPRFERYRPDLRLPDGLEDTVRRCLAKNPDDRFGSVEDLVRAIDAYLVRLELPAVRERGSLAWLPWVGAAAVAGLVLAWWLA
jgi:serine/threonine protein kinase